jgi:hypothetical protein
VGSLWSMGCAVKAGPLVAFEKVDLDEQGAGVLAVCISGYDPRRGWTTGSNNVLQNATYSQSRVYRETKPGHSREPGEISYPLGVWSLLSAN